MSFNLKLATFISVLAILLWFVFQTFVFSTDLNKFGIKTTKSNSGGGNFNPQQHAAAGFAAFEELKELEKKEKKARHERDKKFETNQEAPAIAKTENSRLSASSSSAQLIPPSSPLLQLQVEQAAVAQQIQRLQISQTQASLQATQAQISPTVQQRSQQASQSNSSQSDTSTIDVINPASTNIRAIDAVLSVENSTNCQDNYVTGVFFKKNSVSMRGQSLQGLDALIQEHRYCLNSVFLVKSAVSNESTLMLDQRRRDEVKYYLLQRRVDKSAIKLDQ